MFDRKSVPAAGIVAALVVLASEVLFTARTEPLTGLPVFEPTADDAFYAAKRQLIPRAGDRVVLVGDSSCSMDLVPAEIRAAAGVPVLNLGTILNMTPAGFADLGCEVAERDPPPRMIVLAVLPKSFQVTEADAAEWDQLGRYLIAYHRTSPLYTPRARDRWSWFYRKHRLNLFPPEMGGTFSAFAANLSASEGHFPEPHRYTGAKTRLDTFTPTPFARAALHQLVTVAKSRGVPTVLWLNPSPADAVTERYTAGVDEFVCELRCDEPDLKIVQTRMPVRGVEQFGTVTHLNPEAARVYSRELGAALKPLLGAR